MITLQTITTIELSSICNLKCLYCINRKLAESPVRRPGLMTDKVFNKTCELLQKLVDQGTQREIHLNGNGESTMDHKLCDRISRVREILGKRAHIGLSTNGLLMTKELAVKLKESGLSQVDVSPHSPYHARKAAHILFEAKFPKGMVSWGCIIMSHNWAGQLEKEHSVNCQLNKIQCDPIIEGRGYILSEGNITPCCYDFENLGIYGSVFDDDILERPIKPYLLCKTCHQIIPDFILNENNFVQKEEQLVIA